MMSDVESLIDGIVRQVEENRVTPLRGLKTRLLQEWASDVQGTAAKWEETEISQECWVSANIGSVGSHDPFLNRLGAWVVQCFQSRDSDALRRLATCWESGGYEGFVRMKGSQKRGRKDLQQCRIHVLCRIIDGMISTGSSFNDESIRQCAKIVMKNPDFTLSDETVKEWRESLGTEGLKYYQPRKRGPMPGSKQTARARSSFPEKSRSKAAKKAGK